MNLSAENLSKILLIQNMIGSFPETDNMFQFVCRGLEDLPGIKTASYHAEDTTRKSDSFKNDVHKIPIYRYKKHYGVIHLSVEDEEQLSPYLDYIHNICFMIALILEDKRQKELIRQHQAELEQRVKERTRQLTEEINARELSEKKAIDEKERAQRYLEVSEAIITELNLDGTVEVINQRGCEILGYDRNEIEGMNWFELVIPSEIYNDVLNVFETTIKEKSSSYEYYENEIITKHGQKIFVAWHSILTFDKKGKLSGTLSSGQDITAQKKAQARQQKHNLQVLRFNRKLKVAMQKAEESDRLKSAFLANMSHEIRTPMNGILGFAELLNKPNISDYQQKKYITIIQQSGKRMLNIINDLIDISKIESGQMQIQPADFNLKEQLNNLLLFFKPEAEKKGLQLKVNLQAKKDCFIKTDKTKLSQVLSNFIKNAIKFTDEGEITFGYEFREQQLMFFVRDTGRGIPKDLQDKVFDRFRQADLTPEKANEGSGLGLAISKAYIELLDGKIWVESEPEKGSVFCFTLPYYPIQLKNQEFLPPNLHLKQADKEYLILVAEDDPVSFQYFSELFYSKKITLIHASNGQEAIEYFQEYGDRLNAILMDLKMPQVDGYTALKRIKNFRPEIPIIAQSAFAMNEEKKKALAAGFDDYITKPIEQNNLFKVLGKFQIFVAGQEE